METKVFISKSLADLPEIAKTIIELGKKQTIWLFEGEMGAGKTTLIKALCQKLGVSGHVQSPTFALVNEYVSDAGKEIFHFDFYRIKNEEEAMDIGVEEYFYSGNLCLIEWFSKIENLLPNNCLKINILKESDTERSFEISLKN